MLTLLIEPFHSEKKEDSVDNFATILLLNNIPRGDDIAINSADLFALEDLDTDSFDDADFVASTV
ncbi:DUF4344 domain-containing metallopeptidase [Photobacterium leiognathi subsp. mandapamensis]